MNTKRCDGAVLFWQNNILTKIKLVGMKKIDNRSTEPRPWPKSQATTGEKNFIKSHILIMGKAIRYILQTNMVTKNIFILIN